MSIPKKIHYVWVGGKPLPPMAQRCIESWKRYLPEYEIIEWNETNFDIQENRYCREAYEQKKYAFVSDYIRIAVLYQYGGIYMDTDVEIIQPLSDEFLDCEAFSGYETKHTIPTGIMGSVPQQNMFGEILRYYSNAAFINADGTQNTITNVYTITSIAKENGFVPDGQKKTVLGFTLYPQTYFCPLSHDSTETFFSDKTYAIHHFSGSWCDRKTRFVGRWNRDLGKKFSGVIGERGARFVYRILYNYCRFADAIHMRK